MSKKPSFHEVVEYFRRFDDAGDPVERGPFPHWMREMNEDVLEDAEQFACLRDWEATHSQRRHQRKLLLIGMGKGLLMAGGACAAGFVASRMLI